MRISRGILRITGILLFCALTACAPKNGTAPESAEGPAETAAPAERTETPAPAPTERPLSPAPAETPAPSETPAPVETVLLYGREIPVDVTAIAVEEPVEDLTPLSPALTKFSDLREVVLTRNVTPDTGLAASEAAWEALISAYPQVVFSGGLLIGGEPAETLTAYAVPAGTDADAEIAAALRLCPALSELDLSSVPVPRETVAETACAYPSLRILWNDETHGASASDAETLAFSGEQDPADLIAYLSCFPGLEEVDLRRVSLSAEQANAVSDRFPAVAFSRTVMLNGVPFDSFSETLDLSGAKIASLDSFSEELKYFPKLKRIELHDCSLSNEELASLRERYPEKGVVWTVYFGRWSVATDAVAFSTKQGDGNDHRLRSDKAQVLRYCTDLIALDLGHNDLTDIRWIGELKNLQVLILSDNRKLRDISAIGELKKLKYLELFLTGVGDISPLANLSGLLDVNLIYTRVTDVTPLLSCRKLERIWLGEKVAKQIGKEGAALLADAFPDAQFDLISVGSTKLGWREHPRYYAFVRMFDENVPVDPFLP